jgi:TatD DNase family protein
MLIDTHCHSYVDAMRSYRDEWIERMKLNQVQAAILPNIDLSTVESMMELQALDSNMFFPMLGIHPCDVTLNFEEDLKKIKEIYNANPDIFVGVGEIGLDYHWDLTFQKEQIIAFHQQLEWAIELDKPVSIHSRKSNHDVIPAIQKYAKNGLNGVMHCFSGSLVEAQRIIEAGFYLGIGGVVTFPNAGLAEVLKDVPLSHLVLETDAPYLAPKPHRGKQNESSYLVYIAQKLAEIYEVSIEEIQETTTLNAQKIFNI